MNRWKPVVLSCMMAVSVGIWPTQTPAQMVQEKEIQMSINQETPLDVLGLPREVSGVRITGFAVASYNYNSHIQIFPEFAGGAPALADPGKSNFRFDKFGLAFSRRYAPWLSASGAIEVESHRDRHSHGFNEPPGATPSGFGCFSPGTVPCTERFGSEEPAVEVNLDKLNLTVVAPIGNGLALSLGRFDVPFGIERHDEPLLLTATTSDIFRYGRPNFVTGFQAAYQFNPLLDTTLFVVNRWETETAHEDSNDNNGGKTFGGRIGITPIHTGQLLNVGVGGFWGPEQDERSAPKRWVLDVDATWTPMPDLLFAGEFVSGGEDMVSFRERGIPVAQPAVTDQDVTWQGYSLLAHYDATNWMGVSLRFDQFKDDDGFRTGVAQTLQNITVAPVIHLSQLVSGLSPTGAVYPKTRHPLHWVDLKFEYRHNRSDQPVFSDEDPGVPITEAEKTSHQFQLQAVVNF